jgi:hypothetical protein
MSPGMKAVPTEPTATPDVSVATSFPARNSIVYVVAIMSVFAIFLQNRLSPNPYQFFHHPVQGSPQMIAWRTLLYGLLMGGIDTGMLSLIKIISIDGVKSLKYMIIPMLAYALQPWIFISALKSETMTVMNLTHDLTSDVLVSMVGLLYFGEKLGRVRSIGLLLGFISLCLLAYKGPDDD